MMQQTGDPARSIRVQHMDSTGRRPRGLPFVLMRGGTSKGVFLHARDVPHDRDALSAVLLDLMGSPDRRQIDGLGGADKLTSKAAVMGPASHPQADVDYLFGQVGTSAAEVDYRLNCGNLTAAAAVFAIEEGLVDAPAEGIATVRVHNVNTARVITAEVPMRAGRPPWQGELRIDGVPGSGSPIALDFAQAIGPVSGRLLPFGEARTALAVDGLGTVEVTVVDGANLVVYIAAASLGLQGHETPERIDADAALVRRLNAIRATVAQRLGLADYWASRQAPSSPFSVVVAPPADSQRYGTGEVLAAHEIDLLARQYSTGATSKAMAATVASVTGVAARLPGSVVHAALRPAAHDRLALRIGHPSGAIVVEAAMAREGGEPRPAQARIYRTARRIAEGRVFLRQEDAA